jgi:hypothetical protein
MNNINSKCASCEKEIELFRFTKENYYARYGNFCQNCIKMINKNCFKHYAENIEKFNYIVTVKSAESNVMKWKERGYMK